MAIELSRPLLQQATVQGSKSTALNPLGWLIALLLGSIVGNVIAKGPEWVSVTLLAFVAAIGLVYVIAYINFMLTNSDALRSEQFTLSKLAIEKSSVGDDRVGLIPADSEGGVVVAHLVAPEKESP